MILTNVNIVLLNEIVYGGSIILENGLIKEISNAYNNEGFDAKGAYLMPGFIDIHKHGIDGFNVCEEKGLEIVAKGAIKEGTTSFLPTTLTLDEDETIKSLEYLSKTKVSDKFAKVQGIHLEGPFINEKYKGAQNEKFIVNPNVETMETYKNKSNNSIRIVTYAPELSHKNFTKYLCDNNIVPSCGHSSATFKQFEEHENYGLKSITHFHNAQSKHDHRNPGVVTAGFYFDVNVELICDGFHINEDVIKMVYKLKGEDYITLITDSMKATNMPNGEYELGGLKVVKDDNTVQLLSGSLAGSVLTMDRAIRNMKKFTKCSFNSLAKMSSYNQAKLLGLKNLGEIKIGNIADLVLVDENINVQMTIINGVVVYKNI